MNTIKFFKGKVSSKAKFHSNFLIFNFLIFVFDFFFFQKKATIGHETVMASFIFFTETISQDSTNGQNLLLFCKKKFKFNDFILSIGENFDFNKEYEYLDSFETSQLPNQRIWGLVQFESTIPCPKNSLLIASKLDADIRSFSFFFLFFLFSFCEF